MQRMASDYRTGPQTIAVLASGETVSVGTVLKAEVDMLYIVSSITTDGKKIAFDLRELPELADAFAGGGGRSRHVRLFALAGWVAMKFADMDKFNKQVAAIGNELPH
ncbi:hypothetical protein C4K35_1546 [Pseudomonas chlororaphis subsp. piscium]|uniref:hypothetical protein n=1 Tax=Pseudomonas chlororaphis TaxID=587753 RepID=UPI000F579D94|nr:hypothetical protein [Pseudomonas chlororaphis]AZC49144.1 hypothetical protein C4K35_1546 [Pseudomonas chlororaphis subsp. piscium]QTT81174.1 hypothetical protein HUT29_07685 [Pseudomonas chlororaphis]